jgi:hypothetical protein
LLRIKKLCLLGTTAVAAKKLRILAAENSGIVFAKTPRTVAAKKLRIVAAKK